MEFWGTIGPACADPETIRAMADCGMTGIRMNLSHGTLAEHPDWIRMIHEAGVKDLLIDLQGPELRTGRLSAPVAAKEGEDLLLVPSGCAQAALPAKSPSPVPCPPELFRVLTPGQKLLFDDGKILVRVTAVSGETASCTVIRGGLLSGQKSIAAPALSVSRPTLTPEDLGNLRLAGTCGVTALMLPFVRGRADLENLKQALAGCGADNLRIYAKIESREGVARLPEFVHEADCIVIARGDLGNAMPLWELPGCQKRIAALCKRERVPFMVVTQMLDSMTARAVPTRAEVCDVYNAVMDGADSVMLTGETAAGRYPVQAMEYLIRTADAALRDLSAACLSTQRSRAARTFSD